MPMIKKVIHIADIHIPNADTQRPYGIMMDTLIEDVKKEVLSTGNNEEVRIVIVGDIFHQKIKASNEARSLFHKMLNAFNSLCKTIIVAGNHDMLENNTNKLDSITPTFEINHVYDNVIFADMALNYKSGCITDDNIVWAVYSMFDNFAPPQLPEQSMEGGKIVGLFHGAIKGAVTDSGYRTEIGGTLDGFTGCNCVMAGHIHKFQEMANEHTTLVYPSSVFQQNSGENVSGHGFVVWDMKNLTYKFHEVHNNFKIYKFEISSYNDVKYNREKLSNP